MNIRVLHRELGLLPSTLDSFQVHSLLRVVDIFLRTHPLRWVHILPSLLHCLCLLKSTMGPLGPSMWVCLTFGFCLHCSCSYLTWSLSL